VVNLRTTLFVIALSAISAFTTEATAQTPANRITQQVDASEVQLVLGSLHPLARPEFDQGRVPASMMLHHVAIAFRLSPAQQEQLDQLLGEQQDPSSANYHKWLRPEQYADRFGLSPNDAAKITAWLKSQGLTAEGVSRGRTEVYFNGTAAQVGAVLHTEFHRYVVNGETHFANATEASVPSAFAGMVLGFRNLNDFRPKSRMRVAPHFTSSLSGLHYLAPDDFATIYNLQPLYTSDLDGTGVTIAVVGDRAIELSDIDAFRAASNLPPNDPTIVTVPDTGAAPVIHDQDEVEADLDIEWSNGVAKNASILYVVAGADAPSGAFDALQYAIDADLAPVISNSFGNCEANLGQQNVQLIAGWITEAVSQGQTVTSAAGDTGAADCETQSSTIATTGLAVDVPAAIPEVAAVGGSEFSADSTSPSTYWNSANNVNNGSAKQYIPEMTWNDGPSPGTGAFTTLAAGGGGASEFFSKPSWQTGTGVPTANSRYVPDVSLNASPAHDGYLICSNAFFTGSGLTSCVSASEPYRASDGQSLAVIGGTSAGAPTMAGIIAILNQGTRSCGLGNINGSTTNANVGLYAMAASTPSAFHDINPTAGAGVVPGNIVPCQRGTTSCPASPATAQFGFNTTAGYDEATGLGSINADVLATNWPGFANPQPAITTSAVASSSPTANAGVNVIFTATITASGSACPSVTGPVKFTSDGNNLGTAAISNGQAQFATTSLAVGSHQIVAIYQGDTNYQGSTSPAITQTITAVPDYSFATPNPASLTLTPGQSGTSTLTISANSVGFTGTVSFTCTPSSLTAEIACSFNPTSFALSNSTTSGQTILTVATTAPTSASLGTHGRFGWMAASGGSLFAGVILMGAVPKRRWATLAIFVTIALLSAGLGCGSSSNNNNQGNPGTPAGSYNIVVTATSSTSSGSGPTHQVTVPLTVQ